jgi:hypothetical protein
MEEQVLEQPKMWEVKAVRKRYGREKKHRIESFIMLTKSAEEAGAALEGWRPELHVVAVRPVRSHGIYCCEADHLTDAELAVVQAEGYAALSTARRAGLHATIAAAAATVI